MFNSQNTFTVLSGGTVLLLTNALSVTGGIFSTLFGAVSLVKGSELEMQINDKAIPALDENTKLLDSIVLTLKENYNRSKFLFESMNHASSVMTKDDEILVHFFKKHEMF